MPMFVVPKPDGSCHLIADFRKSNKAVKQVHHPLPKTQNIFNRRQNFIHVTNLDAQMQFHTFKPDATSSDMCVIVTPFGKHKCLRLPVGFLNGPSWAQGAVEELFFDPTDVEVCIDDIGTFSNNFDDHLKTLKTALSQLQEHNFSVEAAKCHWCQSQAPWLGHIITSSGILPNPDEIKPILNVSFPKTVTKLRSFIGMVNFHRAFWKGRADIMAPLTALSGRSKGKSQPTPELINAFNAVKKMIAENVSLQHPDPNLPHDLHTNASDKQLGAVIKQNELPVAFHSQKLSPAQAKHPTIDKEMPCIVKVLKERRTILWGASINVCTDHIDLARNAVTSNRIVTWRMSCEEFSPVFHCIEGPDNIEADASLQLPFEEKKGVPSNPECSDEQNENIDNAGTNEVNTSIDNNAANVSIGATDHFINCPLDSPNFPTAFQQLEAAQQQDATIQNTAHCQTKRFHDCNLKACAKNGISKIALPPALIDATIKWYHHTVGHAGADCLLQSVSQFPCAPGLRDEVCEFCETCNACQ